MAEAGSRLNIKAHLAGQSNTAVANIVGPADIEGHICSDSRFYVLDFARTFPPTFPVQRREYLYKLMRPEWVATLQ